MTTAAARLERIVGLSLRIGVTTSSAALAVGLLLAMFGDDVAAAALLNAGVVVLLVTPVVRVLISIVEYGRERDWPFVALTVIVLIELLASAAAALFVNRQVK
jgi:uncharacterized membrane protein